MKWKANKGFTLVELLVSISIIAIILLVSSTITIYLTKSYNSSLKDERTIYQVSKIQEYIYNHPDEKIEIIENKVYSNNTIIFDNSSNLITSIEEKNNYIIITFLINNEEKNIKIKK